MFCECEFSVMYFFLMKLLCGICSQLYRVLQIVSLKYPRSSFAQLNSVCSENHRIVWNGIVAS